jgi:hypothetical protein
MFKTDNLSRIRELIERFEVEDQSEISNVMDSIKPYVPLPMSVWQVSSKNNVIFSKGNGIIDDQAKTIKELFTVGKERSRLIEAHSKAYENESLHLLINESGRSFSVKLVCDHSINGDRVVTGFAIEVSDIVRGFLKNDV